MLNENIANHLLRSLSQELISAGGKLLWLLLELATLLLESFIILLHFYLGTLLFGSFFICGPIRAPFSFIYCKAFFQR